MAQQEPGSLKSTSSAFNSTAFKVLRSVVGVAGVFIILSILFPKAMAVVMSVLWVTLLVIVIVFFALGILVVVGLRKEASRILDILMEGSLSLVDFLSFLKLLWLRFLEILREFILYATPLFSYILALVLYTLLMMLYKSYGRTHDVTFFTIILTAALVLAVGFLNKPNKKVVDLNLWGNKVKYVFHKAFLDGLEVIIFIFFLTMDSTDLFFLSPELNIPLKAELGGYDFMVRSFVSNGHLRTTLNIIIAAITLEIVRNLLKIIASARRHYTNDILLFSDGIIASRATRIKNAIRKSFTDAKDDLVRFITFTTVLFGVFLLFPRLKLLTLAIASFSSLILDIVYLDRLFAPRSDDLVSRVLAKIFRI